MVRAHAQTYSYGLKTNVHRLTVTERIQQILSKLSSLRLLTLTGPRSLYTCMLGSFFFFTVGECCLSWSTCILLDLMGHTGFIYHLSFAWRKVGETWDEFIWEEKTFWHGIFGWLLSAKLLKQVGFFGASHSIKPFLRSTEVCRLTYFLLWKLFECNDQEKSSWCIL